MRTRSSRWLKTLGVFCAFLSATSLNADSPPAKPDSIVETPALPYILVMMVRDPAVQTELQLKPKQVDDVRAAIAEVDETMWQIRDVPIQTTASRLEEIHIQLRSRMEASLTKSQLTRLDQIVFQARGHKALVAPDTAGRLQLSADQTAKLKTILQETLAERETAEKGKPSPAERGRTHARTQKAEAKRVLDVLSTKQETELFAMTGKLFEMNRLRRIHCLAPEVRGVDTWINSKPLTFQDLRGKVVVVHFWAFGCINCIRNLPHYQSWYDKFNERDVVILGLQTPETEAERSADNLRMNVTQRGIRYPVAFDAASENWKAWGNQVWPAVYLVDKRGQVRGWWYGELNWEGAGGEEYMRKKIVELLAEK